MEKPSNNSTNRHNASMWHRISSGRVSQGPVAAGALVRLEKSLVPHRHDQELRWAPTATPISSMPSLSDPTQVRSYAGRNFCSVEQAWKDVPDRALSLLPELLERLTNLVGCPHKIIVWTGTVGEIVPDSIDGLNQIVVRP